MDQVTEYESTLNASPDATLPTSPPTIWPTNPNTFETAQGGWISESEDELMETSASNELPLLPQSLQIPDSLFPPPIATHMAIDSTTTPPAIRQSLHLGEGSSVVGSPNPRREGRPPLFYYLGQTHWKRLNDALWTMREEEGMVSSVLFGKTIGDPPVLACTGEPVEDTVPLLAARAVRTEGRLHELEKFNMKKLVDQHLGLGIGMEGHARAIEKLRDQVKQLQEDNVKLTKGLETKGKKVDQLEEELKFYKGLTLDMGTKFIEWDSKMTKTFEALAKAASIGIDRPPSSS